MTSGLGADAHSDDSADSVELPLGMISECLGYPRSIDADLRRAGTVAKSSDSCRPFAAMPGRTMVNYRITSELSGVSASSPSFTMTRGPPSRRVEPEISS